jgi:hypothetical protein
VPELRCWQCGVEPEDVIVVRNFGGAVDYIPDGWPAGDHKHAVRPPTPDELVMAGWAALDTVRQITLEAMDS